MQMSIASSFISMCMSVYLTSVYLAALWNASISIVESSTFAAMLRLATNRTFCSGHAARLNDANAHNLISPYDYDLC